MKILVTGSTGLVGTALIPALIAAGHTVFRLMRPESRSDSGAPGSVDLGWNPRTGELDPAAAQADAVVNLAGNPITAGRWTAARKAEITASRVDTTRKLVEALARLSARPEVFLTASGIGYYGSHPDAWFSETSPAGTDFLARLGVDWEAAAAPAEALGARVVPLRIGVVLAKEGGALGSMLPPFRVGLGGRLGTGEQWVPWVALADTVGAIRFALETPAVRGPINVVAPHPVTNADFTRALGRAVHRPTVVPMPAFVMRLLLGEMADVLLLTGQRGRPAALEAAGYRFLHPELPGALAALLAREVLFDARAGQQLHQLAVDASRAVRGEPPLCALPTDRPDPGVWLSQM